MQMIMPVACRSKVASDAFACSVSLCHTLSDAFDYFARLFACG
jgi:hypothetical protein